MNSPIDIRKERKQSNKLINKLFNQQTKGVGQEGKGNEKLPTIAQIKPRNDHHLYRSHCELGYRPIDFN